MKTLIIYYSFTHNNELLAKEIQSRLQCDLLRIDTLKKRSSMAILWDLLFNRRPAITYPPTKFSDYDRLIFVAPIWAARIASPLKTFLHGERINIKRYSFITLCGGGNKGQHDKIVNQLISILQTPPDSVMELWLTQLELPKLESKKSLTSGRIVPRDLLQFQPQINEFLKNTEQLAAIA